MFFSIFHTVITAAEFVVPPGKAIRAGLGESPAISVPLSNHTLADNLIRDDIPP